MPKRFEPNRRLLRILVGSNLYGSPDACIRELIQNSWDAIQLRKQTGDGKGGTIQLRYSEKDHWFEVIDDGIGMDLNIIENSFLEIGQDKIDVLNRGTRETQIGYFGIGILSIFLVADKFQVGTRSLEQDAEGIRFEIGGLDEVMELIDEPYEEIGTCIRVFLRSDGSFSIGSIPKYLSNYARHVEGITIISVDDETHSQLVQRWVTDGLENVRDGDAIPGVVSSRFSFSPALRAHVGTLASEITICNAGFLAETAAHDLLPLSTIGLLGEIDIAPNTLTMGMSRERIQRDEFWTELGMKLQELFTRYALEELSEGSLREGTTIDLQELKRNILLWYKHLPETEPFTVLHSTIEERIFSTIPFPVVGRSAMALARLLETERNADKLYFRDISRSTQLTEHIDDEGLPIRVFQEIRDSIRVGALRARGFDVIELGTIPVNIQNGTSVQTHQIQEQELLHKCIASRGGSLVNIIDATESDMDLRSIEKLPILNDALSIGSGYRFVSVPDSTRRVIADSTGVKYINLRNADVQEILEVIPGAISNPLRSRLLDAYLQLETFQFHAARGILRELLMNKELVSLASAETAPFTKSHMESLIKSLQSELEG